MPREGYVKKREDRKKPLVLHILPYIIGAANAEDSIRFAKI